MTIQEHEPLAPHTTLGVGGEARFFSTVSSVPELAEAVAFARAHAVPIAILGGGSNTLVPDSGFEGLVISIAIDGLEFEGDTVIAGAGVSWNLVVDEAAERALWGLENLAGIPGTVGGAVVQNIGAYGVELKDTLLWADLMRLDTGKVERCTSEELQFGYRDSLLKKDSALVVVRVALGLSRDASPHLSYPDLARAALSEKLESPKDIAKAVRSIRAKKFPQGEGTAGSFFKNPIISKEEAEALVATFPGLPTFPTQAGGVKVPLAWILDHALQLKGYEKNGVRLYENQPIVLAVSPGARASAVDALANEVAEKIKISTGISVTREVVTLAERKLSTEHAKN
jgi:UDP-N-acetylmuramate dehydrogenase